MLTVEALTDDDREPWERLFRAYISFYERALEPEVYDRAWTQFIEGERIHARVAKLDGEVVGIAHFLFTRTPTLQTSAISRIYSPTQRCAGEGSLGR